MSGRQKPVSISLSLYTCIVSDFLNIWKKKSILISRGYATFLVYSGHEFFSVSAWGGGGLLDNRTACARTLTLRASNTRRSSVIVTQQNIQDIWLER